MKTVKMKISELHHPEKNTRRHPQKQINEMKRSIKMFGQFRPVVVDEKNVILAGNGLVIGLRELGIEDVDVIKYDNLTENQKKKLMLADNQVASLGTDDYAAIEEFIKEITKEDLDIPGYDEETLALLVEESTTVIDSIQSYGIYSEEEVNQIKENEADRMANGIKPIEQTYVQPTATTFAPSMQTPEQPPSQIPSQPHEMEVGTYETPVDMRKFVICPNCGEKIYI